MFFFHAIRIFIGLKHLVKKRTKAANMSATEIATAILRETFGWKLFSINICYVYFIYIRRVRAFLIIYGNEHPPYLISKILATYTLLNIVFNKRQMQRNPV